MKTFDDYEDAGRSKFKKLLDNAGITDYSFPTDKKSRYDCRFTKKGETFLTEIKLRAKRYESYNDLLLEKSKYDGLHAERAKEDDPEKTKILYANCYEDSDTFKISDITNKEYDWEESNFQRTQCADRGWVAKLVAYITDFKLYK